MGDKKVIADPIHGTMVFEPYLIKIIDHPFFQRLRNIKQLQAVEHVYPGGIHSRFSHSLGVCFLAGRVLDNLKKYEDNTSKEAQIDDDDRKCVTIAALCHDIGHGPFSHLYETVAKEVDGKKWKHETKSLEITRKLLETLKPKIFDNTEEAIKRIQTMIEGKKIEEMTEKERNKAYLYQIVNNANSGVDVDKWDYFTRDSHACGFPSNFDKDRAISMVRVHKVKLGEGITANVLKFPIKDRINLYNMFGLRYTLHSKVYQHKGVCCVHEMIADVLKYVDSIPLLQYDGKTIATKDCRKENATDEYRLMDDRLLYLIYNTTAEGEGIQKAKDVIKRIQCRDFYQCIEEKHLPRMKKEEKYDNEEQKKKEEEIIAEATEKVINETKETIAFKLTEELKSDQSLNVQLEKENTEELKRIKKSLKEESVEKNAKEFFRIKIKVINYGDKDKNLIKKVYFYGKKPEEEIENDENDSPMVPQCFEEKTIQIICTLSKKLEIDWGEIKKNADVDGIIKRIPEKIEARAAELRKAHAADSPME